MRYAIQICTATRTHPSVELGVSPRGILALIRMAKACAILHDRNYVVPSDIQYVFSDVCSHRLVLKSQAKIEGITGKEILEEILSDIKPSVR